MKPPLKGKTQTAQTRLKDGRQVLAIALDRDGIANLLDRPDAFALLELPDFLGHGPLTVMILAAERHDPQFETRLRALLGSLTRGEIAPAPLAEAWESPGTDPLP